MELSANDVITCILYGCSKALQIKVDFNAAIGTVCNWLIFLVNLCFIGDMEAFQKSILTEFYLSTEGYQWRQQTHWCTTDSTFLNEWYGITTNELGEVISMRICDNQMEGWYVYR